MSSSSTIADYTNIDLFVSYQHNKIDGMFTANRDVNDIIAGFFIQFADTYLTDTFVTYEMVFEKVYNRIMRHPDKPQLLRRLEQEILDSNGMCFTGCITRLVNVLVGYYDDIHIAISDASQINARIDLCINTYSSSKQLLHQKIYESLHELDVPDNQIQEWIDNLVYNPKYPFIDT